MLILKEFIEKWLEVDKTRQKTLIYAHSTFTYWNGILGILPDRVKAMCRDQFEQMIANVLHRGVDGKPLGPRQKTIIFCATDRHADLVAAEMNNLFAAYTAAKSEERIDPYAFKCTESFGGNDFIPDYLSKSFRTVGGRKYLIETNELIEFYYKIDPFYFFTSTSKNPLARLRHLRIRGGVRGVLEYLDNNPKLLLLCSTNDSNNPYTQIEENQRPSCYDKTWDELKHQLLWVSNSVIENAIL